MQMLGVCSQIDSGCSAPTQKLLRVLEYKGTRSVGALASSASCVYPSKTYKWIELAYFPREVALKYITFTKQITRYR